MLTDQEVLNENAAVMKNQEFKETQRFRDWGIILLLLFFIGGLLYRTFESIMEPGQVAASTYLLFVLMLAIVLGYFLSLRLFLKVDEKGIKYQFYPWHAGKHRIRWDEVRDCEVVNASRDAVSSGWTVSFEAEKRFSVTGRRAGLKLDLKNGEQIFLGTRQPEQLKNTLQQLNGAPPHHH